MTINFDPLDNPIYSALTSVHKPLSQSSGCAIRYIREVSTMAAFSDIHSFSHLHNLVVPQEPIALLRAKPLVISDDWHIIKDLTIEQMVCTDLKPLLMHPIVSLQQEDVPDMVALASVTEPGPFSSGTIRTGRYFGIKSSEGKLLAMAGERLKMDGFTEISAVCTDPDFRGRGYAGSLISFLAMLIFQEGKIPFLEVKTTNEAKKLYKKLGFTTRAEIQFTMIELL